MRFCQSLGGLACAGMHAGGAVILTSRRDAIALLGGGGLGHGSGRSLGCGKCQGAEQSRGGKQGFCGRIHFADPCLFG